jgi:hypothetical protein
VWLATSWQPAKLSVTMPSLRIVLADLAHGCWARPIASWLIRAAIALSSRCRLPSGISRRARPAQIGLPTEGWRYAIAFMARLRWRQPHGRASYSLPPLDTGGTSLPASAVQMTSAARDGLNQPSASSNRVGRGARVWDLQSGTNSSAPSHFDSGRHVQPTRGCVQCRP